MKKRELIQQFKNSFYGKVDQNLYCECLDSLMVCVTFCDKLKVDSEAVSTFAFGFTNLKNELLTTKRNLKEKCDNLGAKSLIEKINTRKEFFKAERLCNKIFRFEKNFEKVFNFTLNEAIIDNLVKVINN